jgi:hypothetical protein
MNVSFIETKNNCPIAIIDNFYSFDETKIIKTELKSLYEIGKLKILTNKPALDENKNPKQNSISFFLDDFYSLNRDNSKILNLNRKLFFSEELRDILLEKSLFYNHIFNSNADKTLVNFYSEHNFYRPHKDKSCFTALSFFNLENFLGGDLTFPDFNIRLKSLENRTVIFPGFLLHEAEKIECGVRVSIAQFTSYK